MAERTRARGRGDTSAPRPPRWKKLPRRAFAIALTAAALLHAPFVPTSLWQWLHLVSGGVDDYDDPDASAIIPIDLDLMADPSAVDNKPPEPAAAPAPSDAPKPAGDGLADAGPASDGGAIADAGDSDAGKKPRRVPADAGDGDAGDGDAGAVDAGPPPLREPLSAAGGAGKISAKDPNVQVLIAGNVIRKHELGAAFSRLLLLLPEWQQFFDKSPIDPIRDFDHVLITAPRFVGDTSQMVAVMDFNVPAPKIKAAVDEVVQRTGGEWLDDAPVPTARAKVLNGDRLFALVQSKRLLVLLPVTAKDQLEGLKKSKGFSGGSKVGIVVSMLTPARPFKRVFPLPESLKWMRLAVTPTADGGADVTVEAGDASAKEAADHAAEITRNFELVRKVSMLGLATIEVFDHVDFTAEGDHIKGTAHVSNRQIRLILGGIEQQLLAQAAARSAAAAAVSALPSAPPAPKSP